MYADDSIMCCLFPHKCNMFPQTPVVIFSETMEYLNMMIVISSPILVVWSIMHIVLTLMENKRSKLIEHKDSEENCFDELNNEVETECTDDHCSDENNYDGDRDEERTGSDSDLAVPSKPSKEYKRKCILDESNSDCFQSDLTLPEILRDSIRRNSSNSSNQCESINSSGKEETFVQNHIIDEHDFDYLATVSSGEKQSLTVIPEKLIKQEIEKNTDTDQLKDTLSASKSD